MPSPVLELLIGDTTPFVVEFRDGGSPEDLVGVSSATLAVVAEPGGASILERTTAAGNLALDVGQAKVTGTLTQGEADALPEGFFMADCNLLFGSGWRASQRFDVLIRSVGAPRTP